MELEPAGSVTLEDLRRAAAQDGRPTLPEPPPVRLVAVNDVSLTAAVGMEARLDAFYVGLLRFEKESGAASPVYAAEKFRIVFTMLPALPERDSCRPLGILVWFFQDVLEHLKATGVDYDHVHELVPGQDAVLLQDPAGNWVAIGDLREVR